MSKQENTLRRAGLSAAKLALILGTEGEGLRAETLAAAALRRNPSQ